MEAETSLVVLERERYESTRDYAIRCLSYNIVNLHLAPGQLVSESIISEQLELSRTPVREAFFDLSKSGLLKIMPQRGTRVSYIDLDLVEEARFARWAIERCIVQQLSQIRTDYDIVELRNNLEKQKKCQQSKDPSHLLIVDNTFHELLFRFCQKESVYNFLKRLRVHFDRVRKLNIERMDMERLINDHTELTDAIEAKDEAKSLEVIDRHLTRVIDDLHYLKLQYPDYFLNKKKRTIAFF
ncbi:MAG: GntR family transcriptional regulator [Treponema sp.]|jgi:DNA-binding GntR family transcriptional regulator|nr:GntR family transcriptional regulator [Treponema sp.]